MKHFIPVFAFICIVFYSLPVSNATPEGTALKPAAGLADGMYLVARKAEIENEVKPVSEQEQFLVNDGHLIEPSERGPVEYVVLDKTAFVPFKFTVSPKEDHEPGTGKPRILMELASSQSANLERLSEKNVGKTVAIVINGQIVTCHKIREPIKGGKLQITRCTKKSCELIYSQLLKDRL